MNHFAKNQVGEGIVRNTLAVFDGIGYFVIGHTMKRVKVVQKAILEKLTWMNEWLTAAGHYRSAEQYIHVAGSGNFIEICATSFII